ncbi:unnamed protein product [Rhizoctonia solani]|uniref:Uncharacterized protein n=1 Tax=Rhizoctonia solani TaxID=456999 RepID=A0A8H3DPT4_9AGAM|nr:unnamed protein product [Rhizoctonia solani]CAE6532268.1 unnamed protein product [Rhizoctonia solani]
MYLVSAVPVVSVVALYLPPRYEIYRKRQERTWLDALYTWRDKTRSKLTWIEEFRREEGNLATHIVTPVLTCTVYEKPTEYMQTYIRCAASNPTEAIEGARSAVRSRLGGKVLLDFYWKMEDSGKEKSHCRYKVANVSYTYRLDNWAVAECRSEGTSKKGAQQKAARRLLESRAYCMFVRNSSGKL